MSCAATPVGPTPFVPPAWEPCGGMPALKITKITAIATAPDGIRLVVVRVETSEPGLYGVGCASGTTRPLAEIATIEHYLSPFLLGRDPNEIEDIYQAVTMSGYWRSGPVLNHALAGMPVHQLLGGKTRRAAAVYSHASGRDFQEVEDQARGLMEAGFRHIRCQVDVPGNATYGVDTADPGATYPPHFRANQGAWSFSPSCRIVPRLFEHPRATLGEEVELLRDVHERLPQILAMGLARELEPFHLFFLEDPFAP